MEKRDLEGKLRDILSPTFSLFNSLIPSPAESWKGQSNLQSARYCRTLYKRFRVPLRDCWLREQCLKVRKSFPGLIIYKLSVMEKKKTEKAAEHPILSISRRRSWRRICVPNSRTAPLRSTRKHGPNSDDPLRA